MNAAGFDVQAGAFPEVRLCWRPPVPPVLRPSVWPGVAAAVIAFGLLLSFHQVVRGVAQQGELRRIATATHAAALWRCNALRSSPLRESCRVQLDAAVPAIPVRTVALLAGPQARR